MLGYQTDELPAFYTRNSGYALNYRVDTPLAVAQAMAAQWGMGLAGGMVIANPIEAEFDMPKALIDQAIETALADAAAQGVSGKASTPFLLARVNAPAMDKEAITAINPWNANSAAMILQSIGPRF